MSQARCQGLLREQPERFFQFGEQLWVMHALLIGQIDAE